MSYFHAFYNISFMQKVNYLKHYIVCDTPQIVTYH